MAFASSIHYTNILMMFSIVTLNVCCGYILGVYQCYSQYNASERCCDAYIQSFVSIYECEGKYTDVFSKITVIMEKNGIILI